MNLIFRLVWLFITASWRKPIGITDVGVLSIRVLPTDLDINFHLTNARYLSMMDLGRVEFIIQAGMMKKLIKRHWFPVVAIANLKFHKQINPFQRFKLLTRIVGWDEKWIYMEQRFEVEGQLAAVGLIKGLFRGRSGNVATEKVMELAGYQGEGLNLPKEYAHIFES
jgi:acyl-CoA thioesterase FadM